MKKRRFMTSGWGILMGNRLAISGEGLSPLVYRTRARARTIAKKLREHVSSPCKVVRVLSDIRTEEE